MHGNCSLTIFQTFFTYSESHEKIGKYQKNIHLKVYQQKTLMYIYPLIFRSRSFIGIDIFIRIDIFSLTL